MPDTTKKVIVNVEGKDKTAPAFKSATTNAVLFGKSLKGVDDILAKLGLTSLAFTASIKILNEFSTGMKGFAEEADIINLMNQRLESAGISLRESDPQIRDFVDNLEKMGMQGEEAENAIGLFATKTRDLNESLRLTKLASDLSASGYGSITDNVERLSKVLTGNGQRALLEYGIKMEGTHSKAEQLAAIQTKITRTTEEFASTSKGQLSIASESWDNFRKSVGKVGVFFRDELVNYFNGFLNTSGGNFDTFFSFIAEGLYGLASLFIDKPGKLIGIGISGWIGEIQKLTTGKTDILDRASSLLKETLTNPFAEAKNKWKKLGNDLVLPTSDGGSNPFPDLESDTESLASKMKETFTSLSKKIVSSFSEQIDAIKELKNELKDLDKETSKQLQNAKDKYYEDVKNTAKRSQERIKQIDDEIEKIQQTRSQGWRTEIAGLEKEKEKEKAIVAKAESEIGDIKAELEQDSIDTAKANYEKEIAEIQATADEKKKAAEEEIASRQSFLGTQTGFLTTEGLNKLSESEQSFAGGLGYGKYSYVFNFNGDVNDKEALMRAVVELLNRQAELKGIAGK